MTDLKFDFDMNDIVLTSGDFDTINVCSLQNGTLMFNKSATSITSPQFGVGFEEIYPYLPQNLFGDIELRGENQIVKDGALYASINIVEVEGSIRHTAIIQTRYRGE